MLGLDVPPELYGPGECLTAVRTGLSSLPEMDDINMILEVLLSIECLITVRTPVRPRIQMDNFNMIIEVIFSREFLGTKLATERPFLCVGFEVTLERIGPGEYCVTMRTDLILFFFHGIFSFVSLEKTPVISVLVIHVISIFLVNLGDWLLLHSWRLLILPVPGVGRHLISSSTAGNSEPIYLEVPGDVQEGVDLFGAQDDLPMVDELHYVL